MELHQLRYFVAVADEGGFCKAAAKLRLSQPSLSQQVRRLERSLGRNLFDRLGRRTLLTEAGRALLPRAKQVLADVRELEGTSDRLQAAGGRLAIGAIPTIAPYLLPRVVKELLRVHRGMQVVIREDVTDRLVPLLVDAELDMCVLSPPLAHPLIQLEVLGSERLYVAVPKGHAWAARASVPLSALDDEPMVVLHEEHCFGRQLASLCAGASVCPSVGSVSAQLRTALELVAAGVGFTVVPAMCAAASRGLGCVMVPLAGTAAARGIALGWRKDRTRTAAGEAFASALTRAIQRTSQPA